MTHRPHPSQQFESVAEAFDVCAQRFGANRALSCGAAHLTYAELDQLSGAVAARLASRGVRPGDLVGVVCEKRIEMPAVLLGILKAGAAYVPLDPGYPPNRLQTMAQTVGIRWLAGRSPALEELKLEAIDYETVSKAPRTPPDFPPAPANRNAAAYVMFTSGSTGQPKGVIIPHRGILRLVIGQNYCRLGPDEIILQHSPVSFDASTFEIWGALLNGGELVIYPEHQPSLRGLGAALRNHNITTLWLTAGLFHAMVDERIEDLLLLRQLLTGGDVVSPAHAAKLLRRAPHLTLINGYGPTENTTFTCCHTISLEEVEGGAPILIGQPISGTRVRLLDQNLHPVEPGQPGELCAAGDGLALGYWGDPELTAQKFVPAPGGDFIYRTGDQARENEAGDLEFLGRLDQQVKIRGFRIELSEIETALNRIPGVRQCCVVAEACSDAADKTLIAHYAAAQEISGDEFKAQLAQSLPPHAIPAFFSRIARLPLTPNGKVDRKALPSLREILAARLGASPPQAPGQTARLLAALFAEILEVPAIPPQVNFFDLGASSLQIARVHEKLQETLGRELPITDFFQFTTVEVLADHLDRSLGEPSPDQQSQSQNPTSQSRSGAIALVALAGRFPGADDVETFWQNLLDGKETISRFTAEELDFENARAPWADPKAEYVRARGIVNQSDFFDAKHFGIPPKEALEMDPQHRLLLEVAQTALENAGVDPDRHPGKIGIFCGSSQNSYLLNNLCQDPESAKKLAAGYPTAHFNSILGNDKDFLPSRIAYKLNLKGPAISVQCACSTSLAAVAQACDSLRAGHCDMALAGGVSLGFPQKRDYLYTPDGIASRDGHCRTFDAAATGTVFGEGAALVVLRRLEDALAAGDSILAVIKGYAVNNDGGEKAGYAAPGIKGQSEVIREALRDAGVTADDIGYVEAHGTATPLGDPIEIAALTLAFRETTARRQFCKIGSAKTNVGHLDIAAGVTGLIKAALTVRHGIIPPLLHFEQPNPRIDFESSPFVPATRLEKWTTGDKTPRRAGVSAFGVGGTNVHLVLEEPPDVQGTSGQRTLLTEPASSDVQGTSGQRTLFREWLFPVSASSPEALRGNLEALAAYAEKNPGASLDSLAAALQHGRREYSFRAVIQAGNGAALAERARRGEAKAVKAGSGRREVIFMFPGQGSQHPGMAAELYEREPVFRAALDECAAMTAEATAGLDLIGLLFPCEKRMSEAAEQLRHTAAAQPAIFAVAYALARQWNHWGVTPACLIGHSIGEFVAACLAGVFSLRDALGLICARGRLMGRLPEGWMLSVRASSEELASFLSERINLAAVNGARSCVIAGPPELAEMTEQALAAAGLEFKRLHTSHAFHSAMMDPIVAEFEDEIGQVRLAAPSIPILSTVTGNWLQETEATDPRYWAAHLRQTVRFYEGMRRLWRENGPVFLEVGPGSALAALAGQNPDRKGAQPAFSSLPHAASGERSHRHIRETLGQLWCHGVAVNWDRAEGRVRRPPKVGGPNYAFERERFYFTPAPRPSAQVGEASPAPFPPPFFFPYPGPAFFPCPTPPPFQAPQPPPDFATTTMSPKATSPTTSVENALKEVLSELSGIAPGELESDVSFLELGFDSLLLTQAAKEVLDTFGVRVTLRQMIDDFSNISSLARFLEKNADPAKWGSAAPAFPQSAAGTPVPALHQMPPGHYPLPTIPPHPAQMACYYPGYPHPVILPWPFPAPASVFPHPVAAPPAASALPVSAANPIAGEETKEPEPAPAAVVSGPATMIDRDSDPNQLTPRQRDHLRDLIERYTRKTAGSKALTQRYRKVHADPRTVSGFNRAWKEMVYQIVTTRSKGSRLLDVDGNEYIDLLNGFGPGFLGHSVDFLVQAVENQLHQGYEVGPQCLLAMEAAELFCEVTGHERASFVCTGSEAVQAAMRLARTVTKRDKIVIFARDYHGNFDEALVRGVNGGGVFKSMPSVPGIPKAAAGNMIVLPYGTEESLEAIRKMAHDLAAVMIEPVQSRRPEFRPHAFIREVREITQRSGALFIFDEVVTGFRFGPRGAQEFYGVDADLCTYGKVVGGGMPLGVVAGRSEYMNTFDGGMWQYGDDSFPEHPVTFFAGTFVRHPLVMASVKAMLQFFKAQPPQFWHQINAKGDRLAGSVRQFFARQGIPMEMPNCGSLMFVRMGENQKYGNLFFYHLREKGVFLLEGFPSYMTAAHSDEDIDYAIAAFEESAYEMQEAGFFDKSVAFSGYRGPSLQGPPRLLTGEGKPGETERKSEASQSGGDRKAAGEKPAAPLTVPTTEPQREILTACRLDRGASCAFNESASLILRGALDVAVLEQAFAEVVRRHDVLRATFSEDGLSMTTHPEAAIAVKKWDLRGEGKSRLEEELRRDASTPYDLQTGPLIRPMLFQTGEDEHYFVLSAHHLACDGWSYNVIAEELCALYNKGRTGQEARLEPAKQYAEFSRECELRRGGEEHRRQRKFWLDQFSSLPEPIALPLDRPYPLTRTYEGSTFSKRIDRDLYLAVKKAGARHGSTLYSTLCAACQVLFHRLTGQDDLVICIPAAGQNDAAGTENLVGHCVHFLPLRSRWEKGDTFTSFLRKSRQTLLSATDNRFYTYGELIRDLNIPRDPRRMPLSELAFNVERMDYFGRWEGLEALFEPNGKTHVHYTFFMNIVESDQGLLVDVDYNSEILDEATVAAWTGSFEEILRGIAKDPSRPVSQMDLMSAPQRQMIAEQWSQPAAADAFPQTTVHALFEDQVRQDPSASALLCGNRTVSYGELNRQADAVAACLVSRGVEPGQVVALMAHREPETVAGILGILKAGAAYAPIDPAYPEDRIRHLLSDSGAKLLLRGEGVAAALATEMPRVELRDALQFEGGSRFRSVAGTPESLAYVIYTSGSTGQPKGTMIPHRGIVRLVKNTDYMDFGKDQVFLLSAPISFDASTLELWGPLLHGGKLAFPASGAPSLSGIADAVRRHGVTTLWLTSGLFSLMVDECPEGLRGVKQLLAGGDVLSREHAAKALRLLGTSGKLINGYGPTENTTFTCCHTVTEADTRKVSIPIGRPIAHTSCHILDEFMQPAAPRVRGRLYIGGAGLSLGYLNQPELTREKFVPHPFSPGEILYDSGDECRWHTDGTIEYFGRSDRQVKVAGFRIEPGEIESALMRHPGVERAVVRVTGSEAADKQLMACVVPKVVARPPQENEVRAFLGSQLPAYMIPSRILFIDTLPVTANGKIDYGALPSPKMEDEAKGTPTGKAGEPATETEKRLLGIWDEVLHCGSASVNASFFDLGGHSLAGLKMLTLVHRQWGKDLPLAVLFQAATIRQLAARIDQEGSSPAPAGFVTRITSGKGNTPLFLVHGGDGGTLFYKPLTDAIQKQFPEIYVIEAPMSADRRLNRAEASLEATAALYCEAIRPLCGERKPAVGGYSFGGVVALEMARILEKEKPGVECLILFDTNNPANESKFKNSVPEWLKKGWTKLPGESIPETLRRAALSVRGKLRKRGELYWANYQIQNCLKSGREMDAKTRAAFINQLHAELMNAYTPGTFGGKAFLFRADTSRFCFDDTMGWGDLIPQLQVAAIPGSHLEIFDEPHIGVLIERFRDFFPEVDA